MSLPSDVTQASSTSILGVWTPIVATPTTFVHHPRPPAAILICPGLRHGIDCEAPFADRARDSIDRSTNHHSSDITTCLRRTMHSSPPGTNRLRPTGSPGHRYRDLPILLLSIRLPLLSVLLGRQQFVCNMLKRRHERNPSVV